MGDKFYIGLIEEQYGEFEVKQSLLLRLPEDEDPDKYMEKYNRDWYGQGRSQDDENEGGWIENDWMMHRAGEVTEISESCFDELFEKADIWIARIDALVDLEI